MTIGKVMNIAVIGGGRRCEAFLEMLEAMVSRLQARIVAVADLNEQAVGMRLARAKGIYTTTDCNDFFSLKDVDLVIELTGNETLLEAFQRHKPKNVRVLEAAISHLFSDMIRFMQEHLIERRQLQLVREIVRTIFFSIQDKVLILRPDMKILDANDAMLQSVGMKREDVLDKYCYQVSHLLTTPCDEKGHRCPLKESFSSGSTSHAIHEHFDHNDEARACEVTIVPLKNKNGEIELLLEIVRDITDELERRVEDRTRVLTRNLSRLIHEDKMVALGKLVACAVHEINNPLTGIHALARLVSQGLKGGLPNNEDLVQYRYYLDLIDTESARCSTIVSNLLSFARQQKMEQRTFQLNDVVHTVVSFFAHQMRLRQVRLVLQLETDIPAMKGDTGQIQQCLVNLLFNAMEAMPDGGQVTIRTAWEPVKRAIRLEIEDTGFGIPQDMIPHVFEPFFSTKHQDKGVGLGLSVVHGIITEHHGSIFVKSEEGKGSNFIIRFFPMEPWDGPEVRPHLSGDY